MLLDKIYDSRHQATWEIDYEATEPEAFQIKMSITKGPFEEKVVTSYGKIETVVSESRLARITTQDVLEELTHIQHKPDQTIFQTKKQAQTYLQNLIKGRVK